MAMASDWIKMRVDLSEVEEVVYLSTLLKMEVFAVIGRLHKLWSWVDKNSLNGNALRVTHTWINDYVACKNFAENLKNVGWLKGKDGNISFPNFDRHNGSTAKKRAETNLRVALHRETKLKQDSNGHVTQKALQKALPEKRREENIKKEASPPKKVDGPWPPTIEDCTAYALAAFGLNGEFASDFFRKCSAANWETTGGHPITNWQGRMKSFVNRLNDIEIDRFKVKPAKVKPPVSDWPVDR
jgi:hypothetical protein